MKENVINILYKLTKQAVKRNEVPVACLIVYKNKIIAKSYNKRVKTYDPTSHAEINCIRKAAKKLKTCFLTDCEMYSTLTPCEMCTTVIKEARIKKVYYILENTKKINKEVNITRLKIENNHEFKKILTNFFKDKR